MTLIRILITLSSSLVIKMQANIKPKVHQLNTAKLYNLELDNQSSAKNDSPSFAPMIRLEKSRDIYKLSIVMPPSKCKSEWVKWDNGKLRLAIPPINYINSPVTKPGLLRWITLPDDASRKSQVVGYAQGCMVILIPRQQLGR